MQINQLPVGSTTLSTLAAPVSNDQFVEALKERLSLSGYAIRTGQGASTLQVSDELFNAVKPHRLSDRAVN